MEFKHLMYVPFTGLGKHKGFRGNTWLKNRIEIFKKFVVPSLLAQTNQNFILWISWRREEKNNPLVKELSRWLENELGYGGESYYIPVVHTFSGVCFYDDKYPDEIARERLINAISGASADILNIIGECDHILVTLQPSDDCYANNVVEMVQEILKGSSAQAVGFSKGYIMNYTTKEVAEYNPLTNPPFYTIKFPREIFIDPFKHLQYTALKRDVGPYKKGTPLPSHEYIGDCLRYLALPVRRFLVGTHGVNISTNFNIPYKGEAVGREVLNDFGIYAVPPLKIKISLMKKLLLKLPYKVQRKLRYWFNEKLGL